uniref:(northern house mosquito) hypothetical protein n=1 Tax=Culex pipiens TaxID=7175 RepID=A0A8D8K358_CULPI
MVRTPRCILRRRVFRAGILTVISLRAAVASAGRIRQHDAGRQADHLEDGPHVQPVPDDQPEKVLLGDAHQCGAHFRFPRVVVVVVGKTVALFAPCWYRFFLLGRKQSLVWGGGDDSFTVQV